MKKNLQVIICALLGLITVPVAWADIKIQEGAWEISIVVDRVDDGSPNKPRFFSCCLSEKQLIPVDPSQPKGCEYTNLRVAGEEVRYTRTCRDRKGKISETSVELTFTGGVMTGYLHTIIEDPKTGVSDRVEYMKGVWQGHCPATRE